MQKWLILDRDGVINHDSDQFIKSPDEWQAIEGSLEAIASCNQAGYQLVIISNQSGIARGLFDLNTLETIHDKLKTELTAVGGRIERIYFCPHGPDDNCGCRKPLAGMFRQFAADYKVNLEEVYAVGDSVRDLQAALTAGARPVLLRTGKGPRSIEALKSLASDDPLQQVPIFNDLTAFCHSLLAERIIT